MPEPFEAGRYHSLIAQPESLPDTWKCPLAPMRARSWACGTRRFTIEGVQFHPESVLTPDGPVLMGNFLQQRSGKRAA